MKLIVGLGNPGKEYEKTRHNIGFMFLDYYASKYNLNYKKKNNGLYSEMIVNGEKILLLKPQTYMNLSGNAVQYFVKYFSINIKDILVIYDDINFNIGSYKIRRGGSSGGHNGINDIINKLSTNEISRIKIGISNNNNNNLIDYVLEKFKKDDIDTLNLLFPIIEKIVNDFTVLNINKLMEKYNGK